MHTIVIAMPRVLLFPRTTNPEQVDADAAAVATIQLETQERISALIDDLQILSLFQPDALEAVIGLAGDYARPYRVIREDAS